MPNLTTEQQTQLRQNLKLLEMANQKQMVATIASYKGSPVVNVVNPQNRIRRDHHKSRTSGASDFTSLVFKALGDRSATPVSSALKEQIVQCAENGSLEGLLNKNTIRAITKQRKLLSLEPPATPETPIKKRAAEVIYTQYSHFEPDVYTPTPEAGCYANEIHFEPDTYRAPATASEQPFLAQPTIDYRKPLLPPEEASSAYCDESYERESIPFSSDTLTEESDHETSTTTTDSDGNSIPYEPVSIEETSSSSVSTSVSETDSLGLIDFPNTDEFDAAEVARDKFNFLTEQIPDISLPDCKDFLHAYYQLCLLDSDVTPVPEEYTELVTQLQAFYTERHQAENFKQLDKELLWQAITNVRSHLSDQEFQDLLAEPGQGLCKKTLQQFVSSTMSTVFSKQPHLRGHRTEKVTGEQLQLMRELRDNSLVMSDCQYDLIKDGETTPTAADANAFFHKFREDIDRFSIENRAFRQFMQSSTNLDIQGIQTKVAEKKDLSPAELKAVTEARKLRFDVEKGIGRTWDQSVLTREDSWGQDDENGYSSYMAMLELSKLCNPQIMAFQRQQLNDTHQQAKKHSRVVIEGSGINGLLLAITQLEAGATVTLVETDEKPDHQVLKLDPLWVHTAQYYLGDQFQELFSPEDSPEDSSGHSHTAAGILRQDGSADIPAAALKAALETELSALTESHHLPLTRRTETIEATAIKEQPDAPAIAFHTKPLVNIREDIKAEQLIFSQNQVSAACKTLLKPVSKTVRRPITFEREKPVITKDNTPTETGSEHEFDTTSEQPAGPPIFYGKCSWSGGRMNGEGLQSKESDSERTTVIDGSFFTGFISRLTSLTSPAALKDSGTKSPQLLNSGLSVAKPGSPQLSQLRDELNGKRLDTHCAETSGQLTLSMEMPPAFENYLREVQKEITQYLGPAWASKTSEYLDVPSALKSQNDHDLIGSRIMQAWFSTVAAQLDVERESIQTDSIVVRSGISNSLETPAKRLEDREDKLIVSAVGNTTAQTCRPDGEQLTAVREQIFAQQQLTEEMASPITTPVAGMKLEELEEQRDHVAFDDYEYSHERSIDYVLQEPLPQGS
ncbi:hypothetical protein EOPP23_11085 [Endozoicomonas sp. OPT23]|uniref:hypothetical protein n=1 Tax=Endozoicomonas sp. OPT23 TaxID=2072845 RepID=UPI00129A9D8B|nr:hypothetical protein [Endozoicomonas sp. OPT23]MRI33529.1 hypothetical protein [Endozoicomonas sp. OPT23]